MVRRSGPVINVLLFLSGHAGIALQPLQTITGLFPDIAETPHVVLENRIVIKCYAYRFLVQSASYEGVFHILDVQGFCDLILVGFIIFEHKARLLGKKNGERVSSGYDVYIQTAITAEGHLEKGYDKPSVAYIMAGKDHPASNELLDGVDGPFELRRVFNVGAFIAYLLEDLGQTGPPKAVFACSEINEAEPAASRALQVGGNGPGNVRC